MVKKYVVPSFEQTAFHCPHCDVYAHQAWCHVRYDAGAHLPGRFVDNLFCSICQRCQEYALWLEKQKEMIYPTASIAPLPSEDMPEDVKQDFQEARGIANLSPRAAAALLRLSLQKLMIDLTEKGENLNEDIGNLVKKGLPEKIQKALDSVRVIGNNAVHPGQINLKDDRETAILLFELVNMIVEFTITQRKRIDAIFEKIPEGAKKQIKKRDGTP